MIDKKICKSNKKIVIFIFFIIFSFSNFFSTNIFAQENNSLDISNKKPAWRESVACSAVAPLKLLPEAVFMVGDNKAIQAFHRSGTFLWRTYFKDKPVNYLYTSKKYFIYLVTNSSRNGIKLHSLNRNGEILWEISLPETPEFLPTQGKDGRLFIPVGKQLLCINPNGNIKWKLNLNETPVLAPITLSDGTILLTLRNLILHINAFGGILNKIEIEHKFSTITPYPFIKNTGFLAGTEEGIIYYGFLSNGHWDISRIYTKSNSTIISISQGANFSKQEISDNEQTTLSQKSQWGVLRQSGQLQIFDIDNKFVKEFFVPRYFKGSNYFDSLTNSQNKNLCTLNCYNNNWYLCSNSEVLSFSNDGTELWRFYPSSKQEKIVLSSEGDIYTASSDWILYCYRGESRIQENSPVLVYDDDTFGFSTAYSSSYGTWYSSQSQTIEPDLEKIEKEMKVLFVGENEPEQTRRLIEIATNNCNDASGKEVSIANRCKACSLLGYSGSSDAREALKQVLKTSNDYNLTESALQGIAKIAYDPDNSIINLIELSVVRYPTGKTDREMLAACEAIAAISKFNGTPSLEKGVKLITRMIEAPFSFPVRKKAREMLQKLAQ